MNQEYVSAGIPADSTSGGSYSKLNIPARKWSSSQSLTISCVGAIKPHLSFPEGTGSCRLEEPSTQLESCCLPSQRLAGEPFLCSTHSSKYLRLSHQKKRAASLSEKIEGKEHLGRGKRQPERAGAQQKTSIMKESQSLAHTRPSINVCWLNQYTAVWPQNFIPVFRSWCKWTWLPSLKPGFHSKVNADCQILNVSTNDLWLP